MAALSKNVKIGIAYTASNFLIKAISVITLPIFTRLMSMEEIGRFSNITAWMSILVIVVTLDLFNSLVLAHFDFKDDIDSYIFSNLLLGTLITFMAFIIVLIFRDFFQNLMQIDFNILVLIFTYLLFQPAIQMFQVKCRITFKYKPVVVTSILSSVIATGISLICVLNANEKLLGRIYGFYIPMILFAGSLYIYFAYKGKKIKFNYWKYSLSISVPMLGHVLAGIVLNSSDRIMITNISGSEQTALYSIGYSASLVVSILWSSMNRAWSPWAYEMMNKQNYPALKDYSKPYFLFFICIVFVFVSLGPEVIYILGGQQYEGAIYVLPPVMLGFVFQFVYSLYINIETFHKKQKSIALSTVMAALINVILNVIFIPIFGFIAAAYTTLIGYMFLLIFHYLTVKKIGVSGWYDINFFVKCLIGFGVATLAIGLLYDTVVFRYFVVVAFIIIVIIKNRRDLYQCIKYKTISPLIENRAKEKT